MNTALPTEKNADELDLAPLLLKAIRFFRRFGKGIVLLSFLGMVVGCLLYYLLPRSYKATLVLQSSVLSNQQGLQVIDGWDAMLNKRGRPTLAYLFGLSPNSVEKLNSLTPVLIPGAADDAGLTVEAQVDDSTIFPAVQSGMLHALESNPYIRDRLAVRRQNLMDQIGQSREELRRLDSVKPYLRSFSESEKDASGKLILDVSNITTQRLACEDRIASMTEKLQFMKPAYVLQGFMEGKASKIVPAPVLPLAGLMFGFLMSYCFGLATMFREQYMVKGKPTTD